MGHMMDKRRPLTPVHALALSALAAMSVEPARPAFGGVAPWLAEVPVPPPIMGPVGHKAKTPKQKARKATRQARARQRRMGRR
jgi:hypothetical protein